MKVKLRKIGNSWGVIFPKEVVEPFLKFGFENTYIETGEILLHKEESQKKSEEISKPLQVLIKEQDEKRTEAFINAAKHSKRAPKNMEICATHKGYKWRCKCK